MKQMRESHIFKLGLTVFRWLLVTCVLLVTGCCSTGRYTISAPAESTEYTVTFSAGHSVLNGSIDLGVKYEVQMSDEGFNYTLKLPAGVAVKFGNPEFQLITVQGKSSVAI